MSRFRTTLSPLALPLLLLLLLPPLPTATLACAIVAKLGMDVDIAEENALIVFDANQGIEHFIRKADFVTDAGNFGFLVPTPSEPDLAPTGRSLFSLLKTVTEPQVEWVVQTKQRRRLFRPGTGFDFFYARLDANAAFNEIDAVLPGVDVVGRQQVAGYDAAILKATDLPSLKQWLEENEYVIRPELDAWLQHYVESGWFLTAFKFTREKVDAAAASSEDQPMIAEAVRLSFPTEQPFYPYREPSDAREGIPNDGSRLLRLFVLSNQRLDGHIGTDGPTPASTVWSDTLAPHVISNLNRELRPPGEGQGEPLPIDPTSDRWVLTELEDRSYPRQGTDELYLQPATDQASVARPTIKRSTTRIEFTPDLPKWPFWLTGIGLGVLLVTRWPRRSTDDRA